MAQRGQILNPIFTKPSFERIEIDSIPDEQLAVFPDRIIHQTRPWTRFLESTLGGEPILAVPAGERPDSGLFHWINCERIWFQNIG